MAISHTVQPEQDTTLQPALESPTPQVGSRRGNHHAQGQLEPADAAPAPAADAARRLDRSVAEWAWAIAQEDLVEAELALAGLGVQLRQLPQIPETAGALQAALSAVGGTGDATPDAVLHGADQAVARLRYLDQRHGALTPYGALAPARDAQHGLGLDLPQQTRALRAALEASDTRAVYRLLAGDSTALRRAYGLRYSEDFHVAVVRRLPRSEHRAVFAYANAGGLDIHAHFRALTVELIGTDEDELFTLLEGATDAERAALRADPAVALILAQELSERQQARCWQALGASADDPSTETDLRVRLASRKGLFNDDEDGMLRDVAAWALTHGPEPTLDAEAGEPQDLVAALAWLDAELSAQEFLQACNLIRTGGRPALQDRLTEAAAATTLGVPDVDEEGIYAALRAATPAERQTLLADPAALEALLQDLDPPERARATTQLQLGLEGDAATALDDLLAELDSPLVIDDDSLYDALDRMTPADLQAVRRDPALMLRLEGTVLDLELLHALLGERGTGASLAADNPRVIARIEEAMSHVDDHEDRVFEAVLAWQDAGGQLDPDADAELLTRAQVALAGLDDGQAERVEQALAGERALTWRDRLAAAGAGLGTDDAGLEATLDEVPDAVLVLEWSNLPDFAARARAAETTAELEALEAFVPDVSADITALIAGERGDAVALVADLRARLGGALTDPVVLDQARAAFGYVPLPDDLERLRYARATSLQEQQRGDGNGLSRALMDPIAASGTLSDRAFGGYHGAVDAQVAGQGQQERTDKEFQAWLTQHDAYKGAKSAAAEVAAAVVEAGVALLFSLATGGAGAPLLVQCGGVLVSGIAGELTQAAVEGLEADPAAAAQDLVLALFDHLATGGLKGVAKGLNQGIAGSAAAQAFVGGVSQRLGPRAALELKAAGGALLGQATVAFPRAYAQDLVRTEGLLRQESLGLTEQFASRGQAFALQMVTNLLKPGRVEHRAAVTRLTGAGDWDALTAEQARQGKVDAVMLAAVKAIAADGPVGPADHAALLCKLVGARGAAAVSVDKSRASVADTLRFFSEASPAELQRVAHLDPSVAARLVATRASGFRTLDAVLAVSGVKQDVLGPAARDLHDDWLQTREREQTPGESP